MASDLAVKRKARKCFGDIRRFLEVAEEHGQKCVRQTVLKLALQHSTQVSDEVFEAALTFGLKSGLIGRLPGDISLYVTEAGKRWPSST